MQGKIPMDFIALRYGIAVENQIISKEVARRAGARLLKRGTIHIDGKEYKVDGVKLEDDKAISSNVGSLVVHVTPVSAPASSLGALPPGAWIPPAWNIGNIRK